MVKPSEVKWWRQRLTQASDVNNDATRADVDDVNNDVSGRGETHVGTWECVGARQEKHSYAVAYGRLVWRVSGRTKPLSDAWKHMQSPMESRLPRMCRSRLDDLNDTFTNVIGAIFAAVMQRAVVCAVWNSLTTMAASPEPKDNGWKTSEVQRRETATAAVMAEAMLRMESHQ